MGVINQHSHHSGPPCCRMIMLAQPGNCPRRYKPEVINAYWDPGMLCATPQPPKFWAPKMVESGKLIS